MFLPKSVRYKAVVGRITSTLPVIRPNPFDYYGHPGPYNGRGPYNGFIRPGPYINQNFLIFETWVGLITDRRPGPYIRGNTR